MDMRKLLELTVFGLMLMWFPSGMAQTLVTLTFHNGSSQEIEVSTSGKIYFSDNYMYINDGTAVPYSFAVENIRNMVFTEVLGVHDIETESFSVYPNPVNNEFYIQGNDAQSYRYTLYALDGRLLMSGIGQNITPINMGMLSSGLYILKINNISLKINKL